MSNDYGRRISAWAGMKATWMKGTHSKSSEAEDIEQAEQLSLSALSSARATNQHLQSQLVIDLRFFSSSEAGLSGFWFWLHLFFCFQLSGFIHLHPSFNSYFKKLNQVIFATIQMLRVER